MPFSHEARLFSRSLATLRQITEHPTLDGKAPGIPSDGPLMVIPDSPRRIRNWVLIRRQQPYWRDAIALVSAATPREYLASLESEGVECILTGGEHVDFWPALEELNSRYGLVSPDDAIGTRLTHVEGLRNGVVWLRYDVIH